MKKKILIVSLAIALIATAVGGTLAWFTDEDEAKNVFTIGSIEIVQNEDFTSPTAMIPVGSNTTPSDDANFVEKVVTVKNTGKNPAYVQTFVAVPADLDDFLHIYNPTENYGWENKGLVASNVAGTTIDPDGLDQETYNIYRYVYNSELAVGATTDAAITGVYLDQATDLNVYRDANDAVTHAYFVWNNSEVTGFDATEQVNVYVKTQAIQSEGMSSLESALNELGTKNPWATNE